MRSGIGARLRLGRLAARDSAVAAEAGRSPLCPAPPASPPILVPAATPPCNAGQLEAVGTFGGAATGHVNHPIILRNRGSSACSLAGYADVSVVAASGGLLAEASGLANRGTFFADDPVVPVLLEPGTALLTAGAMAPRRAITARHG